MKKIILMIFVALFSQVLQAKTTLICYEKIADKVEQTETVNLEKNEKTKLFADGKNLSYITEKRPGFFSIELYMSGLDQRLFSEGSLIGKGTLAVVAWTRDELIEIECTK